MHYVVIMVVYTSNTLFLVSIDSLGQITRLNVNDSLVTSILTHMGFEKGYKQALQKISQAM